MSTSEEIRHDVAQSYTEAVTRPSGGGCCCCSEPVQKGVVVKLGGYTPEQLAALPSAAVVNSFGCGNPVALSAIGLGDVVLDLGSGAGIDLFLAAKKVGPRGRAIGIDMTDAMIAKARENIAAGGFTNVEVRKGIIEALPVESASVDWVISNCVINLSPEKPRVFAEIARVLKPGGRMLVSDIVARELPADIRQDRALYSSCVAGAISEEEYVAGLRAAGLAEVEVRERLVYDADQLEAFFSAELPANERAGCCGGGAGFAATAQRMAGKVWSARIYARKPD
ncbi:MAG TPA: arsenite methyltransferase [Polyangia bacterium]|jgi:SAM-dependent methyltransferase